MSTCSDSWLSLSNGCGPCSRFSSACAAGERIADDHASASNGLSHGGFITAAVGLAAIVAAGGWMAAAVACNADPDCAETETCREVPAPPGGVPYKQCVPRQ